MTIRAAIAADRERIREILIATARFTSQEVGWAMDLVDQALTCPGGEYTVQVLEGAAGAVQGYVCYAPTPRSEGVWDLYWIAIHPSQQGRGCGQLLLQFVENEVRRRGARMLLIETSSKQSYAPTVRFYEHAGYREISRIKDFYRIEDDKVVFCKRLAEP